MKGEILRRMSMEIAKDDGLKSDSVNRESDKTEVDDDYLVKTIGAFGLWQGITTVTVSLTRSVALWNIMSIFFLAPVNEFVCVEFSGNVTPVNNSTCYDNCIKYKYSSVVGRSIIEEFALICQDAWLVKFTQYIFFTGLLIGIVLFGWISDRFGRRVAIILSTLLSAVFMVALPYSPTYIIFNSIRFVIGIATGGCLIICLVHVMEVIGRRFIETAGACCLIPDGLAEACLAGFGYFTADWQGYTLSYGVATCIIFVLILFVPESPRWLVAHGKADEAIKVITSAANRNKLETSNIDMEIRKAAENLKLKGSYNTKPSYLDFFKSKSLFTRTLTVFIMWFALGLCRYGVYKDVAITGIDLYLSVVLLGFIQIPFCLISIYLNWNFGRRMSTVGITATVTGALLVLMFVPKNHWAGTLLSLLILVCSNIAFSISYIHLSELYPTRIRNMSFAISAGGATIGALVATYVTSLLPKWLTSLIFSLFAVMAGCCCFTLPGTKGRNLKDAI